MLFPVRTHGFVPWPLGRCGYPKWAAASTCSRGTASAGSRVYSSTREERTIYTIDSPPTDPMALREVVTKHCLSLDLFLSKKPIASHTIEAFSKIQATIPKNATLVLDSGCGTGRSTRHLASKVIVNDNKNNNTWVLGIDRSLARLERNHGYRTQNASDDDVLVDTRIRDDAESNNSNPNHVLWIRAELVDFWRLLLQHQQEYQWNIQAHYLLYPNPYPKNKRWRSRWYGHPSFPLILQLGGDIVIRSNWELYLQEFAQAVILADKSYPNTTTISSNNWARPYVESARKGPVRRVVAPEDVRTAGWSNFERKYDLDGEPTFELALTRSCSPST
ncbi:Methyltransferase [Seminavis robusta]|uniref:tRNA (guanine(46)-N(7))-methyltransferase n=1 Tax=Seminavis robusta TaxID=568900 RepID=A0A9N8DZ75_9STRA|nr:Methyltransferase [Seminavis robusta]|eukprot:Sro463_g148170.1 Methyltransferase (333) ;mRNA; r:21859-22857